MRHNLICLLFLMLCLTPAAAFAQNDAASDAPKVIVLKNAADQKPASDQGMEAQSQDASEQPTVITLRNATNAADENTQSAVSDEGVSQAHEATGENADASIPPTDDNWVWSGDETTVVDQRHSEDEVWVWADRTEDERVASDNERVIRGHGLQLGMSLVGIPGYIFGSWFDKHGNMWDGVANMGFSLDYTMRFTFPMELRLSLSWTSLRTGNAYWLKESNADSPELADYIVNTLSTVAIEAAVYHMIPIIDNISFYYGGGLWGGVVLGDLQAYAVDSSCADYTQSFGDIDACGHASSSHAIQGVPPMLGSLIVTLGFKFVVLEKMTIRAEGGFKGYFYGQVGLGVEF